MKTQQEISAWAHDTQVQINQINTSPTTVGFEPFTTLVFRFFDTTNGTHFFTGDPLEAAQVYVGRSDLVYEQSSFHAYENSSLGPTVRIIASASEVPVYRFFDKTLGTHFYTASEAEKNQVASSRMDLVFEGASFYEDAKAELGDVPVFRFFDTHLGTHFYTADSAERASILASRSDLKDEGVAFYAPTR